MPLTDDQYRKGAIEHANKYCNQLWVDGSLPFDVEVAVDLLITGMKEKQNVASQSLGDMSKSFFEGGTYKAAIGYLKPYVIKKVRYK